MMIMTYTVNTPNVKVVKTPMEMEDCFLRTCLQRLVLLFSLNCFSLQLFE